MLEIVFLGISLKQWLIWGAVQSVIFLICWLVIKYGDLGEDDGEA